MFTHPNRMLVAQVTAHM
ncbi:hypothetical protein A2U01_0095230, partial [Trifolium medium]|nr:hypothetical protein [Trifolium medium]